MTTIRTTIVDGHVHVPVSGDLPDGTEVVVQIAVSPSNVRFGMDESQWRADAEAIKDWNQWLPTIEPIDFAEPGNFVREFQKFNVQAVREQMFGAGQ